jgi:hypothetical protein
MVIGRPSSSCGNASRISLGRDRPASRQARTPHRASLPPPRGRLRGRTMPLPLSGSLSLLDTVRFVAAATGEPAQRVCAALTEAALVGAITVTGCRHLSAHRDLAQYFAHPALKDREMVPPEAWSAEISWSKSCVGRYDLVRFDRAEVERWLASAATQSEPAAEASETQASPSGIRTNKAEAAEEACRQWILQLADRPANKDAAFETAKKAVESIGTLSRKAFERAWTVEAPAKWKRPGVRRKSPPPEI